MQGMDELKRSLWCTKFELEAIRAAAQEEIARKEEEIRQLKELLSRAAKERDEAVESYQALIRQQQWCEESMVCESPAPNSARAEAARPLPEKGKLLQAVMRAGPLLQTLLLAGQLPQWRRPPPQLDGSEIPPMTMPAAEALADGKLDRCIVAGRKRSNMTMIGIHESDVEEGESALQPRMRRRSELVVCRASPSPFLT